MGSQRVGHDWAANTHTHKPETSCVCVCVCVSLVTQSCTTLCKPMDCSPSGSSVQEIFHARILEWVCHILLWEIFPTQGSNLSLLHCKWIPYHWATGEPQNKPEVQFIHSNLPTEGFPAGSAGTESIRNAGDLGSIPEMGRSPGEWNSYSLQYSGLENSMDSIVAKSQIQLSDFHFQSTYWRYLGKLN